MNDDHDNAETDRDVQDALDENASLPDILFSLIVSEWDNWCAPGDEIATNDLDEPREANDGETQMIWLKSGTMLLITAKTFDVGKVNI